MPEKPAFLALSGLFFLCILAIFPAYGASNRRREGRRPSEYSASPYKTYKAFSPVPYCFDAKGEEARPIDCYPRPRKAGARKKPERSLLKREGGAVGKDYHVPRFKGKSPMSPGAAGGGTSKQAMVRKIMQMMRKKSSGGAGTPGAGANQAMIQKAMQMEGKSQAGGQAGGGAEQGGAGMVPEEDSAPGSGGAQGPK